MNGERLALALRGCQVESTSTTTVSSTVPEYDHGGGQNQGGDHGRFSMMAMMMAGCMAVVLLFLLIPVVGWPIAVAIGAVGIVAMLFAHQRMMGHGGHH